MFSHLLKAKQLRNGHGINESPVTPHVAASLATIDTTDTPFLEPNTLLAHAMKFATESGGGLTLNSPSPVFRWLADQNPRASLSGAFLYNVNNLFTGGLQVDTDAQSNMTIPSALDDPSSELAYVPVGGLWSASSPSRAPLFNLPYKEQRFSSISQLSHLNWSDSPQFAGGGLGPFGGRNTYPAYPLGNSFASPYIASNKLYENAITTPDVNGSDERTFCYDLSYYLNDTLYDDFFLTGYRPNDNKPSTYPNSRLTEYKTPSNNDLTSVDKAAANLTLKGAFNVNSTSENAWACFLGGLREATVGIYSDSNTTISSFNNQDATPVFSISSPTTGPIPTNELSVDQDASHSGYRALNDSEVRWLAKRMVEQVKARGPFPSLSAFVNRTFYDNTLFRKDLNSSQIDSFKLSGAIQSALDSTTDRSYAVNEEMLSDSSNIISTDFLNAHNTDAAKGHSSVGIPGYVTQSHILSQIDSAISVRSDTFKIRAYGDYQTNEDSTPSKVYCEAIVQRLPDYVSDANEPQDSYSQLNKTNKTFGRKFKIVFFKWLTEEEI